MHRCRRARDLGAASGPLQQEQKKARATEPQECTLSPEEVTVNTQGDPRTTAGVDGVAQPVRDRARGLKDPVGGPWQRFSSARIGLSDGTCGFGSCSAARRTHLHLAPTPPHITTAWRPHNFFFGGGCVWGGVRVPTQHAVAAHGPRIHLVDPRENAKIDSHSWPATGYCVLRTENVLGCCCRSTQQALTRHWFLRLFYGCSYMFHLSGDDSRDRCVKGSCWSP